MVLSSISIDRTADQERRTQPRSKGPPDTRHGTRAGASAGSADPWRDVAVRAFPSSAVPRRRLTSSGAHEGVNSPAGVHGAHVTGVPGHDDARGSAEAVPRASVRPVLGVS